MRQVSPPATQRPAKQQPPPLQVEPSQQISPGPPHTAQTPPWHRPPAAHAGAVAQQGSPGPPQPTQVPGTVADVDVHRVRGELQMVPQQACPSLPQAEHTPWEQVPPMAPQALPAATQAPALQQLPPEQLFVPGQQT